MRVRLISAIVGLVVLGLAAGCGGGGSKPSSSATAAGAGVAPGSTALLVQLNTDFGGDEWQALDALLGKFPDGKKLYSSIAGDGADFEQDVKPALGPETDVLALSGADLDKSVFIGLTQPRDAAKFQALLAKGKEKAVSEEVESWRVIADQQATIDRFKEERSGGTLAASSAYREAMEGLPAGAVARLYLDGSVLTEAVGKQLKSQGSIPGAGSVDWLSGALTAKENGFGVDLRLKVEQLDAKPFSSELLSQAPADVLLFLDFKGLDKALEEVRKNPVVEKQLGPAQKFIGGTLDELISLFENEGALYIRKGAPTPEITLVLSTDDAEAAFATVDKLAGLAAAVSGKAPEELTVAGVSVKKLALGDTFVLYYAGFDGKLVVTTQASGIEGLRAGGGTLADSQSFKEVAEAAGMPDETAGFVYANVGEALPLLEALDTKQAIKPEARRNLEPLGAALLFASAEGGVVSAVGFVAVH